MTHGHLCIQTRVQEVEEKYSKLKLEKRNPQEMKLEKNMFK